MLFLWGKMTTRFSRSVASLSPVFSLVHSRAPWRQMASQSVPMASSGAIFSIIALCAFRVLYTELGQLILSIRNDCAALGFTDLMNCVIERIMRDPEDEDSISQDYDVLLDLSREYGSAG